MANGNFIVSGCSYSVGSSSVTEARKNPITWNHLLLKKYNPAIFANLSIPGAGNIAITSNLILFLENNKHIVPDHTAIILNLTELDRMDLPCAVDHPNANRFFSWADSLNCNWLTEGAFTVNKSPFNQALQKNIGYDQIVMFSCLSVLKCFGYLESRGFDYRFMLMLDSVYTESPQWFQEALDQRIKKWIQIREYRGMQDYGRANKLLHTDNYHLSLDGNQHIANVIDDTEYLKGFL